MKHRLWKKEFEDSREQESPYQDLVKSELDDKSLKDIQKETANTWCDRAVDAYNRAIEEKSIKWLMDAYEYSSEAIEHAGMSEDVTLFEKVKAKIVPLHDKARKLLVSE